MKQLLLLCLFTVSFSVFARSAIRPPNVDWTELAGTYHNKIRDNSAQNNAVPFANYYFPEIPRWKYHDLHDRFESIRDDRYLSGGNRTSEKRRLTWLYPQDGCFARTHMMLRRFKAKGRTVPKKIFAFGNLQLFTNFVPGGSVSWWYHVAPIVDVDGSLYVIDPAVDLYRPLSVSEWVNRIGNPYDTKVIVCGAGTFLPEDDCGNATLRQIGDKYMPDLLNKEWDSLVSLGYSPEFYLGKNPPWRR